MPPLPFAGNPFALKPGNCIAVLGINPKWSDPIKEKETDHDRIRQDLKKCVELFCKGDDTQFDEFLRLRASEFSGGPYYGNYYTRLGNHLFWEWFQGKVSAAKKGQAAAKEVFLRYVLKSDLLPWFSVNTDNIDSEKVRRSQNPALLLHFEILSLFIQKLKPRWLQFNGSQMRHTVEVITETDLKPIKTNDGMSIWVGRWGKLSNTPIFVHGFVNSARGPQTANQFHAVAQAFRDELKDDSYFEFH
jgi:hypothetical protein